MAANSKIEWTDHTSNLWWGCVKGHAGCDNCYAEAWSNRFGNDIWGHGTPRKIIKHPFRTLMKYQRKAASEGKKVKVFVGSMMDIFEKSQPMIDHNGHSLDIKTGDLRDQFFMRIDKGEYPNINFLLLTKRPSNINKMIPEKWKQSPPENVWFGCSPVDQKTYDKLVPQLLQVHGNKFLSIEPQLGLIDITTVQGFDTIDWIIQGGESGKNRRPFRFEWAHSLRDQCEIWRIRYFFKQIDKVMEIPQVMLVREFPSRMNATIPT